MELLMECIEACSMEYLMLMLVVQMKCVVKGTIVCLVGGKLMLSVECQVMMGYKGEGACTDTQETETVTVIQAVK